MKGNTVMNFDLNEFLSSVSNALDTIEINIFGMPTNHSKRIAYMSVIIAHEIHLTNEEIFDLASLAIMHDNGATMKLLQNKLLCTTAEKINILESQKEHCIIGEKNLKNFPFLTNPQNIINYHHEKYDGSGFFGLSKDEIPVMAQIIALSDTLDLTFDLRMAQNKDAVLAFVREHKGTYFSPILTKVFLEIGASTEFWEELSDTNIDASLKNVIPKFSHELDYYEIRMITKTLSNIIDAHSEFTQQHSSGLSEKLERMAEFYQMDKVMMMKLLIASDLHDLGKLVISNDLLDKPGRLTEEEFAEIKKHPIITKICLQDINGFEEITKWASNHHEKLDGTGYPEGLDANNLDFNSRLLTSLDIYQALREDRPYRKSMDHNHAMEIIYGMVKSGQLDPNIAYDINYVFLNL